MRRAGRAGGLFALGIAAALGALAPAARAGEIELPGTRAVLDVPGGWTPILDAAARGLVAGYRGPRGVLLAVTRAPVPTAAAYREKDRDELADQIERGIAARVPGYRRVARRFADRHGTPALDLEATRQDGATIVVRVLLSWTQAVALAIEVPPGADAAAARAIAARFGPRANAPKP